MHEPKIKRIEEMEILDSRGNPTIKARVTLENGIIGEASVPSGASTGDTEAHEKRDGGKRYGGNGVKETAQTIEKLIEPVLIGCSAASQAAIDTALCGIDGSENKSTLGANAILALSLAMARAAAGFNGMELYRYLGGLCGRIMPVPMVNILNGGVHAANNVDIQEFMIMPIGADSFCEAVEWCCGIYKALGCLIKSRGYSLMTGDEGGFAPDLASDEEAIELVITAIRAAGLDTDRVKLALDAAASEWSFENGKYLTPKRRQEFTSEQLVDRWEKLCLSYPIISIEDGADEKDTEGWRHLTKMLGKGVQLVGDDLFTTNEKLIMAGIFAGFANSVLIKPNQIGTLSETLDSIAMARSGGYSTIISHRSGETEDSFIADLAVAANCGQIKVGAPCRGERTAKYNRLLEIERQLGGAAVYGGNMPFNAFRGQI